MSLTWVQRLYRRLTSAWSRDPELVPAFTVGCDGSLLAWQVADGVLTLTPTGGTASVFTRSLSLDASLTMLYAVLAAQPGYLVSGLVLGSQAALSPLCLADGAGSTANTNGGVISAATSPQYLVLAAIGAELATAEAQIPHLPPQMATTTAAGSWLDFLGGFYAVARAFMEGDVAYAIRIIQETVRPKCNNVSMARALLNYTGIATQVTDAVDYSAGTVLLNSPFELDGSHNLSSGLSSQSGGLFDVEGGYDLISGTDLTDIEALLIGYINRLKAAGTALRNLTLAPLSALSDDAAAPSDGADTLTIAYSNLLDGSYACNSTNILSGGLTVSGHLSGS